MAEGAHLIHRLAAAVTAVVVGGCLALPLRAEEVTIRAFRADPAIGLVDVYSDRSEFLREVSLSQLPSLPIVVLGGGAKGGPSGSPGGGLGQEDPGGNRRRSH